jgi:FdrA protein
MDVVRSQLRPGAYYDSLVLMQLQRSLIALPGVLDAGAVMATPVNLELLGASGLRTGDPAGPDDLLIVVRARDDETAVAALGQVDSLLARRRAAVDTAFLPKSLEAAAQRLPEAHWVLVSVPGRFAASVARESLRLGKNVFLYSDNVAIDDEVALKREALERGLLVMGPDCGTAIIGGVGFGFANRVRRGPIGIVAASGTGLQAVSSAIDALGSGISQAFGTGGRDLHAEVGAITTRQALDALARDPATEVIVVVSKPPNPDVVAPVVQAARATGKPTVLNLIGLPAGGRVGNLVFVSTLEAAAQEAVRLVEAPPPAAPSAPPDRTRRYLRGLFSGGTLAYETVLRLQDVVEPLHTNVVIRPGQALDDPLHSSGHTVLDLGADVFTVGRLHPMIDNDLRLRRLDQESRDPETAVILLDVVLGEGSHPDPASELAPAVTAAVGRGPAVVVVVVGTEADPQGLPDQIHRLSQAGAWVTTSLEAAVAAAVEKLPFEIPPVGPPIARVLLQERPAAINVGLMSFFESLASQGSPAIQVDWRPPAGGDERLMGILAKMKAATPTASRKDTGAM